MSTRSLAVITATLLIIITPLLRGIAPRRVLGKSLTRSAPDQCGLRYSSGSKLRLADFNADGKADVFAAWDHTWHVSDGGTAPWRVLNTMSSLETNRLAFADFNADGKADVFSTWKRDEKMIWHVSYGGTGPWVDLNDMSSLEVDRLAFADFNADGKADVFSTWKRDGKMIWHVSYGGTGPWVDLNDMSSLGLERLGFADFNNDHKADVFSTWKRNGKMIWHVSYGGAGPWADLNDMSSLAIDRLAFADFNNDDRDDVFAVFGGKNPNTGDWHMSSGGASPWLEMNTLGSLASTSGQEECDTDSGLPISFDMECVDNYSDAEGFTTADDLELPCAEADAFGSWLTIRFPVPTSGGQWTLLPAKGKLRYYWANTDVWPSDFTEDSFGGNDVTESDWPGSNLIFFSGHGDCQAKPSSTDPDVIVTAKDGIGRYPNFVKVQPNLRLGEPAGSGAYGENGNLNAMLLDASCPMDLVSLLKQWGVVFQGLHVAMGHSGNETHDTLDSYIRGQDVGMLLGLMGVSYRSAWMAAGLIEVQDEVCAVITGGGNTETAAALVRDLESPAVRTADTGPANWVAWRAVCK